MLLLLLLLAGAEPITAGELYDKTTPECRMLNREFRGCLEIAAQEDVLAFAKGKESAIGNLLEILKISAPEPLRALGTDGVIAGLGSVTVPAQCVDWMRANRSEYMTCVVYDQAAFLLGRDSSYRSAVQRVQTELHVKRR